MIYTPRIFLMVLVSFCVLTSVLKLISIKLPYRFLELKHDQLAWILNICVPSFSIIFYLYEHFTNGYICNLNQAYMISITYSRFNVTKDNFLYTSSYHITAVFNRVVILIGIFASLYLFYLLLKEKQQHKRLHPTLSNIEIPTASNPNENSSSSTKSSTSKIAVGLSGLVVISAFVGIVTSYLLQSTFVAILVITVVESISFVIILCSENVFSYVLRKLKARFLN